MKNVNNKFLRQYLVNTLYAGRTKSSLTLRDYNKSEISTIQTKYLKFPIPPKCKEVHFKTINIYPSNEFMKSRFKFVAENCSGNLETTEHCHDSCLCCSLFLVLGFGF